MNERPFPPVHSHATPPGVTIKEPSRIRAGSRSLMSVGSLLMQWGLCSAAAALVVLTVGSLALVNPYPTLMSVLSIGLINTLLPWFLRAVYTSRGEIPLAIGFILVNGVLLSAMNTYGIGVRISSQETLIVAPLAIAALSWIIHFAYASR